MESFYLVIDNNYMKKHGFIRTMRFSRTFNDIYDLCVYLSKQVGSQDFKVISLTKEEYEKLKEQRLCF